MILMVDGLMGLPEPLRLRSGLGEGSEPRIKIPWLSEILRGSCSELSEGLSNDMDRKSIPIAGIPDRGYRAAIWSALRMDPR